MVLKTEGLKKRAILTSGHFTLWLSPESKGAFRWLCLSLRFILGTNRQAYVFDVSCLSTRTLNRKLPETADYSTFRNTKASIKKLLTTTALMSTSFGIKLWSWDNNWVYLGLCEKNNNNVFSLFVFAPIGASEWSPTYCKLGEKRGVLLYVWIHTYAQFQINPCPTITLNFIFIFLWWGVGVDKR